MKLVVGLSMLLALVVGCEKEPGRATAGKAGQPEPLGKAVADDGVEHADSVGGRASPAAVRRHGTGDSATASATGFAPFDDAFTGTAPWIAPDDKDGVAELISTEESALEPTPRLRIGRLCGAAASIAVATIGKQMAARLRESPSTRVISCTDGNAPDMKTCSQSSDGDGDISLEIAYAKSSAGWRIVGVSTTTVGATGARIEAAVADYTALTRGRCSS